MSDLIWLGPSVQARRRELGLTQTVLARWAGLSRATVNALESGALGDLSVGRLGRVLQLLGLRLGLQGASGAAMPPVSKQASDKRHKAAFHHALRAAAQTASVSYAQVMPRAALLAALTSGKIAPAYQPHLATLLDEAPLPLVVAAVGAAAQLSGMPAAQVWRHVGAWAREMQSLRVEWQEL
jgi:transcriptional regulator with XRE-family HTH domain